MKISIDTMHTATDIPQCMSVLDTQQATLHDKHMQKLNEYIIHGWQASINEITQEMRLYWTFQYDLAVIDGMIMKGRCNIIPVKLQKQSLDQLHGNHMGIKNTWLLACESI